MIQVLTDSGQWLDSDFKTLASAAINNPNKKYREVVDIAYKSVPKFEPGRIVEVNKESDIIAVLTERGKRYGKFSGHSFYTQKLKNVMKEKYLDHNGWLQLDLSQREALEMIAHKIGRILNGDPNYDDNWIDIAGYAQLVVDEIHKRENKL